MMRTYPTTMPFREMLDRELAHYQSELEQAERHHERLVVAFHAAQTEDYAAHYSGLAEGARDTVTELAAICATIRELASRY